MHQDSTGASSRPETKSTKNWSTTIINLSIGLKRHKIACCFQLRLIGSFMLRTHSWTGLEYLKLLEENTDG